MKRSIEEIEKQTILDTDPTVSLDRNLRSRLPKGTVIHVDMEALRETLDGVGAPQDNSELSIHLSNELIEEDFDSDEYHLDGDYDLDTKHVRVRTDIFDSEGVQETLQHELHHYADFITNPPSTRERRKLDLGKLSKDDLEKEVQKSRFKLLGGLGAAALSVIAFKSDQGHEAFVPLVLSEETYQGVHTALETGSYALLGAGVALNMGRALLKDKLPYYMYRMKKRERTARAAGRKQLPQAVRHTSEWMLQ